jgi:hypothetical protein
MACLVLCSFTNVIGAFHVSHRIKREVSQSLVDKHILQNDRTAKEMPFHVIEEAFNRAQRNFSQKIIRRRHLFIVTKDVKITKAELERAYIEKVNQGAVRVREQSKFDFYVYEMNFKELRNAPVSAIDLKLSFPKMKYSIDECYASDSGTFQLCAKIKNWDDRIFEINHVTNVKLNQKLKVKCAGFHGSGRNLPSGTCPM